ncbi:MAG: DEAD/DEAH box helicase [Saccharofermentans sp.]|nr:DEAD/DEAH box helicase [Saccharofermentans sp.]
MSDITSFGDLDLSPEVMQALKKMGCTRPTTVQKEAIPLLMDNMSVIAKAPTGTGKTFAFGIPILEYLNLGYKYVQALILCPTRELALQINSELKLLGKYIEGFRSVALIGGQGMHIQIERLNKHPQVVVATPGRLLDMCQRGHIDISQIYTLVLDEADEMLKMGFIKDIKRIMALTPQDKQICLFSATMPREIQDITWQFMEGAAEIDVMPKAEDHPDIEQYTLDCPTKDKIKNILYIMDKEHIRKAIVFCNTKTEASKVCEKMTGEGVKADCLHGDVSQGKRNRVMDSYRRDKFDVLVATDVVARGIDVDDIEAVFNYDIPKENELYLHRIGRTARAGKQGKAFSLVSYMEQSRMEEIIRYTKVDPKPYELPDPL